jgi:hypothetical protein
LDKTSAGSGVDRIEGRKRESFLGRMQATMRAAQVLSASTGPLDQQSDPDLERARALANELTRCWSNLQKEAQAVAGPERWLALSALARLDDIRNWGQR